MSARPRARIPPITYWAPISIPVKPCVKLVKSSSTSALFSPDSKNKDFFNIPFKKSYRREKVFSVESECKPRVLKYSLSKHSISTRSYGIPLTKKLNMNKVLATDTPTISASKRFDQDYRKRCGMILDSLQQSHRLKEKYSRIRDGFLIKNKSLKLWKLDNELIELDNNMKRVKELDYWKNQPNR